MAVVASTTTASSFQRSLFIALPCLVWRSNDVSWASAAAIVQSGRLTKPQLYALNALRPLDRFSTRFQNLGNALLYLLAEQYLLLPFESSPLALSIDGQIRTASFEWRELDRAVKCASAHEELIISAYNAAAALTQLIALSLARPNLAPQTTKHCIRLGQHAEMLLHFVQVQTRRPLSPSLQACQTLSQENLDIALAVVHGQLLELWLQFYETVQPNAETASKLAVQIALLAERVYEKLKKDDETLSIVPGFARRLSAVKRYYYRLLALSLYTKFKPTALAKGSYLPHMIEEYVQESRSSITKVKEPLAELQGTLLQEVKSLEEGFLQLFSTLPKERYLSAQAWQEIVRELASPTTAFRCQGSVLDYGEHAPSSWEDLLEEQRGGADKKGGLFNIPGAYAYALSNGQKWTDAAFLDEQWTPLLATLGVDVSQGEMRKEEGGGRGAPRIIPLGDLVSPTPAAEQGSQALPGMATLHPRLSTALKRLERLGRVINAVNNNFKEADRSAPPFNWIWKQIHDYVRVIITCVFHPGVNVGPRELLGFAAQMAAGGEKQLALQSTDLLNKLVPNQELENSMKLIEEVEKFLYDEVQALLKTRPAPLPTRL